MARIYEPTPQQEAEWAEWVAERPDVVRRICERLTPWTLYRLKTTGQRVTLLSASEDGTVKVAITGRFNLIDFERAAFGIDPNDLEECDLPGPNEPLGVMLSESEQLEYINKRRAENGLPPMANLSAEEASKTH